MKRDLTKREGKDMWIMTPFGWREFEIESIPAPHDKSLLEQMGIKKQPAGRIGDAFCRAIELYLDGKISHEACNSLKSQACHGNI